MDEETIQATLDLAHEFAGKAAQHAETNTEHAAQRAQAYAATAQAYALIALAGQQQARQA